MTTRRFPPPWTVEEDEAYFVVRDHDGQQLAYVHFDNPTAAAKPLTRDEARRIASNIAKLRSCCGKPDCATVQDAVEKHELSKVELARNR